MLLPVVVLPLLVASAMATSPVRPVHFGPGPVIPAPGVLGPVRPGPKTGPPSNAPSCPKDEHYVVDTNLCEKTCDNRFIYNVMGPCQPFSKCVCNNGLVRLNRDATGPCIPENECPGRSRCGYNEEWTKKKYACPPEVCESRYKLYICTDEERIPREGCQCIDGHLRNSSNICIPTESCPPRVPTQTQKCGYNEEWAEDRIPCPPESCWTLYMQPPCAPPPPDRPPNPGCKCIDGYLRNDDNVCIPKAKCPPPLPKCPGPNEVARAKKIQCPPQTCESIYTTYNCVKTKEEPGCDCIDGFLRNATGICIPSEECPPASNQPEQCGPNEEWVADRPYCPVDKCFAPPCAPVPPGSGPNPGCQCMDGYLRNNNNVCVPKDQCAAPSNGNQPNPAPQPQQCGPNEEWVPDRPYCPIDKCFTPPCAPVPPGSGPNPGCQCMNGYLRNNDNICVPKDQCNAPQPQPQPGQCGPNEEWVADRPYCPVDNCFETPCAPVPPGSGPNPGCICRKGFLRNNNNICVTRDQCNTQEPVCTGPNEEPTSDVYSCPPQTCSSLNMAFICLPDRRPPPQPGCKCMDGYFRNDNNVCVLPEQCPEPKPTESCPENEVWSAEKILCPPQSCASIYTSYNCLDVDVKKKAGCNCIDGYLRDDNDVCIPSDKCPGPKPICGYNEVYTDTKRTCPPESCAVATGLIAVRCADEVPQPGCVCKEGHARNSSDICIPIGQCPPGPLPICGDNEVYTDRKRTCPPQSCEAASGFIQYLCAYEEPKPGCICRDGYVRDKNDVCIPVAQCPPDSNPNEKEWECDSE